MEGTMQNKRKQNSTWIVLLIMEVPNLNWFVCLLKLILILWFGVLTVFPIENRFCLLGLWCPRLTKIHEKP